MSMIDMENKTMTNQNTESKAKNRWSFLNRGDSGSTHSSTKESTSSPQHGYTPSKSSGRRTCSPSDKSPPVSPRSDIINNSLHPVGLSGPTSFQFSPSTSTNSKYSRENYISFVSSDRNVFEQHISNSGSPVKSIGGNISSSEKRLFVMDLDSIWLSIDSDDELYRLGLESIKDDSDANIENANKNVESQVYPLLNTSLPFNRPYGQDEMYRSSPNKSRYPTSPNSLSGVSDASLSLEEKLRRERQRVHSNGVTQFGWGSYDHIFDSNLSLPLQSRKKIFGKGTRRSPSERPMPERSQACIDEEDENIVRIIVPLRGNIYIQDGIGNEAESPLRLLYDKSDLEPNVEESEMNMKKSSNREAYCLNGGVDFGALDPQLSPDCTMVAFVAKGELYVMSCDDYEFCKEPIDDDDCINTYVNTHRRKPTQITYGAREEDTVHDDETMSCDSHDSSDSHQNRKKYGRVITHGLADFVAQEEMDRYQGFWWNKDSTGIIFARVDESYVPPFRITHQGSDDAIGEQQMYEEHRYPFAGESNPIVSLGYVSIDRDVILSSMPSIECEKASKDAWSEVKWFNPPEQASEYLARVNWISGDSVCVQWQDRRQSILILEKINVTNGERIMLHSEKSEDWINLHHMFRVLPHAINPKQPLDDDDEPMMNTGESDLPPGSFSYIFASERTGFCHIYLYTFVEGHESATLVRAVSGGEWIVESILGVDMMNDIVYFTGTFDSPLEKHLYALPLSSSRGWDSDKEDRDEINAVRKSFRNVISSFGSSSKAGSFSSKRSSLGYPDPVQDKSPPEPIRITVESGMHSIVMDSSCRLFIDTCSDLSRPTTTKIYSIPLHGPKPEKRRADNIKLRCVVYDSTKDFVPSMAPSPPELISFPTSDGTETLYAAIYKPNPTVHGKGPYPLICAVYGGPHVQRVTKSWSQCADMRVQRLCSMGFAVVKCDNRGSSRRGLKFEAAVKHHLGRVEVLDQVTAVRFLISKRIADPSRVGIYGWSYGGYLAAMCLCRAPDIFSVGIAGAPVTSWDGYDTHYTERYMGLPSGNKAGYDESAVFEHVPNMKGKLLIIHGLIDENVHFRHTARLVNRLIAAGKEYDLLLFPDERHSPRRLRDSLYMEKRICDYFVKNLFPPKRSTLLGNL